MSNFLFMTVGALTCGATFFPADVQAENRLQTLEQAPATAMSADGSKLVGTSTGYNSDWTFMTHRSFLWDKTSGISWLTDYDGTDCSKSGVFKAVNDLGMIAGAVKDDAMRLPAGGGGDFVPPMKKAAADEEKGLPIFHAAVWRDGRCYVLDGGLEEASAYENEEDGSYAVGISADGTFVVGQTQKSYFPAGIMGWQYDPATDKYVYVDFATPASAIGCELCGISPDGTAVYGVVSQSGANGAVRYPAIWTDPQTCVPIELPDPEAYAMGSGIAGWSGDGTKVLVYGSGYSVYYLGVYDIPTATLTPINLPEGIYGVTGQAITDRGDIFARITDSSWNNVNYYYDANTETFMTLKEYLAECAADITDTDFASDNVLAVSGDGRNIAFTSENYAGSAGSTTLLTVNSPGSLSLSAPQKISLYHSSPDKVTFRWEGVPAIHEGLALRGYEVYIDGKLVETKAVTEAGGEFTVTADGKIGSSHVAYAKTLYTKGGEDKTSAKSASVSAYLSPLTTLLSFDNFDDCTLDAFGNPQYYGEDWHAETVVANPLVIDWSLNVRDWENNNPFVQVASTAETPWANAYTSRYHDAADADDNLFLSFYAMSKEANVLGQDRSSDYLDVEYSTDGYEWKTLKSICAADMGHGNWNFFKIDLAPAVKGKVFQVRFNAHGEGKAMLVWAIDCIGINDELKADAPEGLRVISSSDKEVTLTWKNTMKAWDASHLINSYVEADAAAANEGEPIMLAIDLRPSDLKAHVGEYISGVSAFLYDMPGTMEDGTRAEAVVYADGKEVSRTAFEGPFDKVVSSTAWLPRPVRIEEGKTYRLAVNLTRYDATYPPLYYQKVTDCIPGVTDLFSEDDGDTWASMHDEYEKIYSGENEATLREYGNCIWSIHADITAEASDASKAQKDSEIIGYNVYRNGEKVNDVVVYAPYIKFTDRNPLAQASYTVQAYYRDGRVSPLSAPLDYVYSAVEEVWGDTPAVSVGPDAIAISGDYDKAELFALGGVKVAAGRNGASIGVSHLNGGIYLLRIEKGTRTDVVKIILK